MSRATTASLRPRKAPVQARSNASVEAIHEATIQVLLSQGAERLTTTRVAERAGVSVGTLYQYYPNKQALLFAVLEKHLNKVADAVEAACARTRGKPMAAIVQQTVEAFVEAKMARADVSTALYRIASEVNGPEVARQAFLRSATALEGALKSAPDIGPRGLDKFAMLMLFGAMAGTTKSVLEAGASPALVKDLRLHLVLLAQTYLAAARTRSKR